MCTDTTCYLYCTVVRYCVKTAVWHWSTALRMNVKGLVSFYVGYVSSITYLKNVTLSKCVFYPTTVRSFSRLFCLQCWRSNRDGGLEFATWARVAHTMTWDLTWTKDFGLLESFFFKVTYLFVWQVECNVQVRYREHTQKVMSCMV